MLVLNVIVLRSSELILPCFFLLQTHSHIDDKSFVIATVQIQMEAELHFVIMFYMD